jgi:mono/diheme cytochrome c family protein
VRASAILLAAALAAVWAATSPAAAASAEAGRQLAQRNCAMCHAIGRQGASPFAAAPPFRTLHERYPVENLQEALAEGILTGHPAMPEFRFSPGEVNDLIAYLRSLQQDAVPSAAAKGR